MAEENIDNTVNGSGLFNTKIPGLGDPADIQEALRLYHYGSLVYDGANTNPANLPNPSIARHLQNLVDADLAIYEYIEDAIDGATGGYPALAGNGIDWNFVDERFDLEPQLLNNNTVITKTSGFTLDPLDVNKTILLSTSSSMNLTVPLNSSVSIPIGYKYTVIEMGTGVTTFVPALGVTLNSKNSQLFIDTRYGHAVLIKVDTNSWIVYGDIYEGASTPTPVAPTPVAPTPVAPTPVAPTPVAPTPVAPTPVAPTPVAPTPVAPTPVAPTPVAPTPVAPTPVAPTPVAVVCDGALENYTVTIPTCNGEDSYEGIWQGTRKLCSDGSYEIVTVAGPGTGTFIGYGNCIATNVSSCGGSGGAGTSPCTTPDQYAYATFCSNGVPSEAGENLNFTDCGSLQAFVNANYVNVSQFTCQIGSYPSPANCSTPTPVAPTPVAPTPVAPTPVALTTYYGCCNNGAGVQGSYANSSDALTGLNAACDADEPGINNQVQGGVSTSPIAGCTPTPTPVAPTPVAPTPVAPTPVAPTPVAPTPVAPTPVAPTPVAPTPVNPCSGDISLLSPSQCTACGYYYSTQFGECLVSAPTPVAPTPVAPTPVAPTPVAPTPVAPTPVAPTPVAPTPVAPTPVAPTPVAPTPVAPTPVASCECGSQGCTQACCVPCGGVWTGSECNPC